MSILSRLSSLERTSIRNLEVLRLVQYPLLKLKDQRKTSKLLKEMNNSLKMSLRGNEEL